MERLGHDGGHTCARNLAWQWHSWRAVLEHFHYDTFTLPIDVMGRPEVVFTLDDRALRAMKVGGAMGVEFRRWP
jgi:hypothetical protein